ncbi:hypothetical protein B0T16DRAFT_407537 [Cercophora newfieldiana]|uniref:NmrA-like domain-containing protein n=1 Tax=Cercophora newfieldiana TaxID=92897 RepID=A0AA40CSP4_9PEZI|nr:hypothetical protein B0T16DRAFT_407537 [Cercophora newfieldiana]
MVKIAIVGGSGGFGREIIDVLVATGKHEVLLLSRSDAPSDGAPVGVTWVKVNYESVDDLADALQGVDTVLSFIVVHMDPMNTSQKNLINAAVRAGVRRFAPSEWTAPRFDHMPWYAGKLEIREILQDLNKDKKVLEYCLFQPGMIMNYLAHPHKPGKYITSSQTPIDFTNRRIILAEGTEDARITVTAAHDLANVVAKAVEYEGEWPLVGGIQGSNLSIAEFIALGEKLHGTIEVERLNMADLEAGLVNSTWRPRIDHPTFRDSPEQAAAMEKVLLGGVLLGFAAGAFDASDDWNKLLPEYKFTGAEEFLTGV